MTNLPHLLLIASEQQARTPAFERAVASTKAAHLLLAVMTFNARRQSALVALARRMDIDLLAIGALTAGNGEKVLGSLAESLLVHAPCDVLVVKA